MITAPPIADPVQVVLGRLGGVRVAGDGQWIAQCPAHPDRVPSLSIGVGGNGCALVHCQAGCNIDEVLAAMNPPMTKVELFLKGTTPNGQKRERRKVQQRRRVQPAAYQTFGLAVAAAERQTHGKQAGTWTYHRADGDGHFRVVRFELIDGKTFRPFHLTTRGWVQADPRGKLPLYRQPELLGADAGLTVHVFEGEKCADAARQLGFIATTSAHGCKACAKTDWTPLAGHKVVVSPDCDAAGQKYAQTVAQILTQLDPPATVKILNLPDLPEHGDIVDFIRGRRLDAKDDAAIRAEIEALAEQIPETEPAMNKTEALHVKN